MLIVHLVHAFCFHGSAVSHPCRASKQSIVNRESKNVAGIMPISPDSHVARQRCGKGSCPLILRGQAHLHAPTCPCARCGPKTKGGTRKKHASAISTCACLVATATELLGELLGGRKKLGLSPLCPSPGPDFRSTRRSPSAPLARSDARAAVRAAARNFCQRRFPRFGVYRFGKCVTSPTSCLHLKTTWYL